MERSFLKLRKCKNLVPAVIFLLTALVTKAQDGNAGAPVEVAY